MATSGTVTFRLDVEQIITEAYERCGIDAQTRTGYQAVSARRSLNLLFSEWANRGINYWTLQNNTVSLVDGQIQYTLPAGTIDLIDVAVRETVGSSISDTVLQRMSIADYNQLPDKTDEGKPSQYMLNKQYTPVMYLWQVPDSSTAYSLVYWSINQLEDITASNEDADVPYRWSDCICAGLATKLALKFAPDRFQILDQLYERTFDLAAATDNDGVSMRIRPTSLNLY
jgi:hypothetical protein|tara:strand:- start:994 stop:1677 length:684 start_codon:yes stop_codon:yes gene_type:complete